MNFAGQQLNFERCIAQFEKPLLKNHAQDLIAQDLFGARVVQLSSRAISRLQFYEFMVLGQASKLEKVERTIHSVHSEYPLKFSAMRRVPHAVQPKRNVGVPNSLKRASPQTPN